MSKTKEEFMEQEFTGSIDNIGDEDYLYEQYLLQEKLNEEYWEEQSKITSSIFPDGMEYDDEYYKSTYLPSEEEEQKNFEQIKKQNGL